MLEFIGPQSPTDRMAELLRTIREGDYSDVAALKDYMDLYDTMGFAHRKRTDGIQKSDQLLEDLDTSESEFDYIVEQYDIAKGTYQPRVRITELDV